MGETPKDKQEPDPHSEEGEEALDQPRTSQERIRRDGSKVTQPEDALAEENQERGAPRHHK